MDESTTFFLDPGSAPVQPRSADLSAAVEEVFGPEALLARQLPGYERRIAQQEMAEAVAWTLERGGFLAAEAGTGVGKTLAYLVPAALSAQKVVISTGTIALQDQILQKEMEFIRQHLVPDLSYLCVKGRQNYLCLFRWHQFLAEHQLRLLAESPETTAIRRWLEETETGDRAELTWLPDDAPLWQEISCSATQCLGQQCPEASGCFLNRLRRQAARARLLIVNHHLFFSDLAIRRFGHAEVLPRYQTVIFDEAHHLENVATRYFGITFSHFQAVELGRDLEKLARRENGNRADQTVQLAQALLSQAELFAQIFPRDRGRYPLDMLQRLPDWATTCRDLLERLLGLAVHLEGLLAKGEAWAGLQRRGLELHNSLQAVTGDQNSGHVYWGERRSRSVFLSASPVEVATDLRDFLYGQVHAAVFTSATLTTGGDFTYLQERFGLPRETATLSLPSPYAYEHRTLLYVPEKTFSPPGEPSHPTVVQERILELLLASEGRGLVLFTSRKAMQQAARFLADRLPYPLLVQGDAPKPVLLETFQQQPLSVLLAVASFWEGIDVPGEPLRCVIIDKLPFEVPNDPVVEARINRIKAAGGNPFLEFQLPRAVLTLRQGLGRLMRSSTDWGLLAILDVRLFTKQYGRLFRRSLPPSPLTRDLSAVAHFFHRAEEHPSPFDSGEGN